MPNHITNILEIKGDPHAIEECLAAIHGGEDAYGEEIYIDFNKIIPMPESLNMESGSRTQKGLELYRQFVQENAALAGLQAVSPLPAQEYDQKVLDLTAKYDKIIAFDPEQWELGKQCYENIQNHGAPTWYEWSYQHWGTKWNAYEQTKCDGSALQFQTAWAGVPELIQALSAKYPTLHFSYQYADEDWGANVGDFEFEAGACTSIHQPTDGSPEAQQIAEAILGPAYEEEIELEMGGLE